jgi:opacity protein-like surface antigen
MKRIARDAQTRPRGGFPGGIAMKRILTGATIALALAAVVHAQAAVTGKWEGETKNGTPIVLDLKATKTELSGTLIRDGQPITITDGKVSKNTITFKATLGEQTEAFTGEVAGDELAVWLDRQGRENAAILKRVKK